MSLLTRLNVARFYRDRQYRALARDATRQEYSPESLSRAGFSSQCGQDKWVAEQLFPGLRQGVFVDIGAHDGVSFSNTLYLEQQLGWTGLAVEPMPDAFERLSLSRSCLKVNGCIAAHSGTARFRRISGYAEMLSGLVDQYDSRHLARIEMELAAHGGRSEEIEVSCYRLNDLLEQHGLREVHYLNVDVEGAELDILRGIDFQAANIHACGIENNYRDHRIPKLMKKMGYRMVAVVGDEFYIKAGAGST